jgi:hypothetical protein
MMATVYVTGKQDIRVAMAILALGIEVATAQIIEIKPRGITGVWRDELATLVPEKNIRHGPQVKGRGGKIKRW